MRWLYLVVAIALLALGIVSCSNNEQATPKEFINRGVFVVIHDKAIALPIGTRQLVLARCNLDASALEEKKDLQKAGVLWGAKEEETALLRDAITVGTLSSSRANWFATGEFKGKYYFAGKYTEPESGDQWYFIQRCADLNQAENEFLKLDTVYQGTRFWKEFKYVSLEEALKK